MATSLRSVQCKDVICHCKCVHVWTASIRMSVPNQSAVE